MVGQGCKLYMFVQTMMAATHVTAPISRARRAPAPADYLGKPPSSAASFCFGLALALAPRALPLAAGAGALAGS